jgi:hypothetical protein
MTFSNCGIILIYFLFNWNGQLDRMMIWKDNRNAYTKFYFMWVLVLLAVSLPGVFIGFPSKVETLIGMLFAYAILSVVWLMRKMERGAV